MIIKNDYIKIVGKKETTLKNYIYDKYLELVAKAQYKKEVTNFDMLYCFLKFDTPFDNVMDKTIDDFDIYIIKYNGSINGSDNKLEANYNYFLRNGFVRDCESRASISDLSEYYDKKITAIGFGGFVDGSITMLSCVNTSNFSIRLEEDTIFQRKDIFISDAFATAGYPANLSPFSTKNITIDTGGHGKLTFPCYPVLYSIGLGTLKGQMEEEYIINQDVYVVKESDTSFGLNLRKGLEPTKYPRQSLYARSGLHPLPLKVDKELHPHRKLYTGSGIVPLLSDYKYIIYKYRYYYFNDYAYDYRWTDDYFTINLPNETKGLFEIVTKIERSDV